MDYRDMNYMPDGRNPYGSEGGYVVSSRGRRGRGRRGRGRRGDRGMGDYGMYDMARGDMNYDMARGGRNRGEYGDYVMSDMGYRDYNYSGRQMNDGHYPEHHQMGGQTYYPIEAMGRFNGYWGMPQGHDYGRYDMRGGRRDYGYGDYGDFGEVLTQEELTAWEHKLMSQLDEREKQMFKKEVIMQKAKAMGRSMEHFGEKELYVTTLMIYTDYKQSIGQNVDLAIKLAFDWLSDKDVAVNKGAEKLAVYYDCIVEGED